MRVECEPPDARARMVPSPLDLVRLRALMDRTRGGPTLNIALIDGPVAVDHPDLADANVRPIADANGACERVASEACAHGTLVAGVLVASRESAAPGICPDCTLLVRPIFSERQSTGDRLPAATLDELADAIFESVDAGARVVNVSAALAEPSSRSARSVHDALDYAAIRGAIVVVAAGNQGAIGSSVITRHPWSLPVVACDLAGRPTQDSNLSHSIALRGVSAPGEGVRSLEAAGGVRDFSGTSAAAPFVTGAIALLWSLFPAATANAIRFAVTHGEMRRSTVVPPLLDASAALARLASGHGLGVS